MSIFTDAAEVISETIGDHTGGEDWDEINREGYGVSGEEMSRAISLLLMFTSRIAETLPEHLPPK